MPDKLPAEIHPHLQFICRKIIHQALIDLASTRQDVYESAKMYIDGNLIATHIVTADYPAELLDSLREIVVSSKAQRACAAKEVLRLLGKLNGSGE